MTATAYTYTHRCAACGQDLPSSKFPTQRHSSGEYHRNFTMCRACRKTTDIPAKVVGVLDMAAQAGLTVEHNVSHLESGTRMDHLHISDETAPEGSVLALFNTSSRIHVSFATPPGRTSRMIGARRGRWAGPDDKLRTWQDLRIAIDIMGLGTCKVDA